MGACERKKNEPDGCTEMCGRSAHFFALVSGGWFEAVWFEAV